MSLHVNYLISCCSSHPKQKCLCVWNKTIGCLCVRITRQSTSTPPFCSAQATMNRVDVSRAPTPETMKKNLFFLNSSYTYIHSQTSFLGEAYKWTEGTPLPPPQPQNLWKRRGEETWANNVRWNQPRAGKTEAPHTNWTAAAHYGGVRFRWSPWRKLSFSLSLLLANGKIVSSIYKKQNEKVDDDR